MCNLVMYITGTIERLMSYKSKAAGKDHDDDEGLEVAMVDKKVAVAAKRPPLLADNRPREYLPAGILAAATLRAKVLRVPKQGVLLS